VTALVDDLRRNGLDCLLLRRMHTLDGAVLFGDQPGLPQATQAE